MVRENVSNSTYDTMGTSSAYTAYLMDSIAPEDTPANDHDANEARVRVTSEGWLYLNLDECVEHYQLNSYSHLEFPSGIFMDSMGAVHAMRPLQGDPVIYL